MLLVELVARPQGATYVTALVTHRTSSSTYMNHLWDQELVYSVTSLDAEHKEVCKLTRNLPRRRTGYAFMLDIVSEIFLCPRMQEQQHPAIILQSIRSLLKPGGLE